MYEILLSDPDVLALVFKAASIYQSVLMLISTISFVDCLVKGRQSMKFTVSMYMNCHCRFLLSYQFMRMHDEMMLNFKQKVSVKPNKQIVWHYMAIMFKIWVEKWVRK